MKTFDFDALAAALKSRAAADGHSSRELGRRMGVSFNTANRAMRAKPLRVEVLAIVLGYLGRSFEDFVPGARRFNRRQSARAAISRSYPGVSAAMIDSALEVVELTHRRIRRAEKASTGFPHRNPQPQAVAVGGRR